MPRFILAFATLALACFTVPDVSYAQRAMAHPLPRPTAAKPAAPHTPAPR